MKINIQFADSTEQTIVAYFSCPQDPDAWPNQGTVEDNDPRYIAFINPPETLAQKAAALLSSGIAIASTGTAALNGTYACDTLSQSDIIAIETGLNAGKGFPGGSTSFGYPDATGAMHTFSETNFTNFAAAVRDFVYACRAVIAGASTTLPAASVTIA